MRALHDAVKAREGVPGRVSSSRRLSRSSWEWLEDPGFSIPPEITKITGITDKMVAGRRIDDGAVNDLVNRVVPVIAHNADFDRRFLEKRVPVFA